MVNGQAGKGDRCRPYDPKEWDRAWLRAFGIKCKRCNGKGEIIKVTGYSRNDVAYDITCPKCKGIGKTEREKK